MNSEMKKGLQKQLKEMVHDDEPIKDIIVMVKEHMTRLNMAEHEVVIMVSGLCEALFFPSSGFSHHLGSPEWYRISFFIWFRQYSRTPLIRPPSESHWCGRIRGMVAREGFVYEQKPLSVTRNVVVGEGGRSLGVLLKYLIICTLHLLRLSSDPNFHTFLGFFYPILEFPSFLCFYTRHFTTNIKKTQILEHSEFSTTIVPQMCRFIQDYFSPTFSTVSVFLS